MTENFTLEKIDVDSKGGNLCQRPIILQQVLCLLAAPPSHLPTLRHLANLDPNPFNEFRPAAGLPSTAGTLGSSLPCSASLPNKFVYPGNSNGRVTPTGSEEPLPPPRGGANTQAHLFHSYLRRNDDQHSDYRDAGVRPQVNDLLAGGFADCSLAHLPGMCKGCFPARKEACKACPDSTLAQGSLKQFPHALFLPLICVGSPSLRFMGAETGSFISGGKL